MREPVVNSTPLITLCTIGRIDLLRELYGTVHIPHAVFDEVTAKNDSACGLLLNQPEWIRVDEGLLEKVAPEIEKIRRNGFWLSDAVVAMALRYAGEAPM